MVKKAFISILAFILVFSLAGCGKTAGSEAKDKKLKLAFAARNCGHGNLLKRKQKKKD